jgi:transposase
VGVDAHKKDLFVAMLVGNQTTPVTWQVANEPNAVRRLVRKLERDAPGPVRMCYEAGPGGYALQRQVTTPRVSCQVIAPALIPQKPGERIKTNRRDARKLTELLRAGLLTEVRPPTPEEEAVRDLCRARDDAREDLQRSRHRLGKLLLRRGLHYSGRNWTRAHRRWVDSLEWAQSAERIVVDDYLLAIDQLEARLTELDLRLTDVAQHDPYRTPVAWLRCFRGIDTLTAILILAELHDFRRFHSPRALMAYLGLVPGEDSTGEKHRRGRITRTGNALVRRLLVETAWHYQHRPSIGVALARRRKGQPGRVVAIADKAQQRLCRRFRCLAAHHKPAPKIAVAIARELAGFLWAALQPAPAPAPSRHDAQRANRVRERHNDAGQ